MIRHLNCNRSPDKWFEFNDSTVRPLRGEVITPEAYLLMNERIARNANDAPPSATTTTTTTTATTTDSAVGSESSRRRRRRTKQSDATAADDASSNVASLAATTAAAAAGVTASIAPSVAIDDADSAASASSGD